MNKSPLTLAFGGLLALAAGLGVGRFIYTPILPPMVEALSLTKSQAGLIASANFLGYLAGALLAAWPGLAGSRRTWLLTALAVNAVALAAMGATTSLAPFLLLRLAAGVASAFVMVFSSALVLDRVARAGRPALSAVHFAGVGFGIALSAALVAILLAEDAAWSSLWYAGAVLALLAIVAVAAMVPAEDGVASAATAPAPAPSAAGFTALMVSYGLFGFGYVITATFIVAMVRDAPGIAPLEPWIWVLFGLSAVPSVALWTGLAARWGMLRTYAIASLVEAVGVACSALWLSIAGLIVAAAFVGGTFVALTALGLVAARNMGGDAPNDARGRIALMTAAFGAGQIAGPAFAGYVYDLAGSFALPSLAAAAALVVAAALALLADRQRGISQHP